MRASLSAAAALVGLVVTLSAPGTGWAGAPGYDEPAPTPVKVSKEPKQAQVRTCSFARTTVQRLRVTEIQTLVVP
jgi:hypothetical protein